MPAAAAWRLGCSLRGEDGYVDYLKIFRSPRGCSSGRRRGYWAALAGRPASAPLAAPKSAKPEHGLKPDARRAWFAWEATSDGQSLWSASGASPGEPRSKLGAPATACPQPGGAPSACAPAEDAWADAGVARAAAAAAASAQASEAAGEGQGGFGAQSATSCSRAPACADARRSRQRPHSAADGPRDLANSSAFDRARYDAACQLLPAPRAAALGRQGRAYWFARPPTDADARAAADAWHPLGDGSQFRTCFSRPRVTREPPFRTCVSPERPGGTCVPDCEAPRQRPATAERLGGARPSTALGRAPTSSSSLLAPPGRGGGVAGSDEGVVRQMRPRSAFGGARHGGASQRAAAGPPAACSVAGSQSEAEIQAEQPGGAFGWEGRRRPASPARVVAAHSAEAALPRHMVPAAVPVRQGSVCQLREGWALAQDLLIIRALA